MSLGGFLLGAGYLIITGGISLLLMIVLIAAAQKLKGYKRVAAIIFAVISGLSVAIHAIILLTLIIMTVLP
jgi:hypothetical protein